ncbi:MFS transporter [Saccharopolyspora erythraea]|uniref:MFS transporter n=1 Tax=Saccharopolyspora erythraea TaxID=1836 RepID=UPI001BA78815|nr:MFS transporter [Saccharopolyspora erythraea]
MAAIGVGFGLARYGYGLFLPGIQREFGLSLVVVGWIGSATYLAYLCALVAVGTLANVVGSRALVVSGGLAATAGMATVALAAEPVALVAGLVLAGTSPALVWSPYSDAVDRVVPPERRETVLALLPTGTAFGVVVAGLMAMGARGEQWRSAWLVFAVIALLVTAYNFVAVPAGRGGKRRAERGIRGFLAPRAARLHLTAFSYGVVGAVYWSFAVVAVSSAARAAYDIAPVFWSLTGVSGIGGLFAGTVLRRCGLRAGHALIFGALACAAGLLGLAPGSWVAVCASALLYGAAFMAGSGLLAVWSYQIFPERPTAGLSAALVSLGLGTVCGPAALGVLAADHGLDAAFSVTAAIAALTLLVRPRRHRPRVLTNVAGERTVPPTVRK